MQIWLSLWALGSHPGLCIIVSLLVIPAFSFSRIFLLIGWEKFLLFALLLRNWGKRKSSRYSFEKPRFVLGVCSWTRCLCASNIIKCSKTLPSTWKITWNNVCLPPKVFFQKIKQLNSRIYLWNNKHLKSMIILINFASRSPYCSIAWTFLPWLIRIKY